MTVLEILNVRHVWWLPLLRFVKVQGSIIQYDKGCVTFAEDAKISVFDEKKGVPTNIKQTSINTHEQCWDLKVSYIVLLFF
jgi:hypothetical protein